MIKQFQFRYLPIKWSYLMPNDWSSELNCGDLACESSTTSQWMSRTNISVWASLVRSAICSGRLYVGVMMYMTDSEPTEAEADSANEADEPEDTPQPALYTTYRAICRVMPVNRSLDTPWISSSTTTFDRAMATRSSATESGRRAGWPCCCCCRDHAPDVWYWTSTTNTVAMANVHRIRICMETGSITMLSGDDGWLARAMALSIGDV